MKILSSIKYIKRHFLKNYLQSKSLNNSFNIVWRATLIFIFKKKYKCLRINHLKEEKED